MKYLLLFFLQLIVIGILSYVFMTHPGQVDIRWLGYEVQTSVGVFLLIFLTVLALLYGVKRFLGAIFGIPSFMLHRYRQAKHEAGFKILEEALAHYVTGDYQPLSKDGKFHRQYLPKAPFGDFFAGLHALHQEDLEEATQLFDELLQEGHRTFGLLGHLQIAQKQENDADICRLSEQLLETYPTALLLHTQRREALFRMGNYDAYMNELVLCEKLSLAIEDAEVLKGKGYMAQAKTAIQQGHLQFARECAFKAMQLKPLQAEAVLLYAQVLSMMSDSAMAEQVIETTWAQAASEALGRFYVDLGPGHDPQSRQFRANRLASFAPHNPISQNLVRGLSWAI